MVNASGRDNVSSVQISTAWVGDRLRVMLLALPPI